MILSIIFALSPIIINKLNLNEGDSDKNLEYNEDSDLDNCKLKSSKISGKIHIDNNWTDAKSAGICTGNGTYSEPYVIEDLVIDGGDSGICILIENSDVYFKIENCTLYNSRVGDPTFPAAGIKLSHVNNSQLINNDCSSNYDGIYLWFSNNNNVSGNTVSFNTYGIRLAQSNKNNINGNIANNSIQIGINLYECHLNNISGNIANNNSYVGIYIHISNNIMVLGNTASNNGVVGIVLGASDNNTVSINTANSNYGDGLYLWYSDNNTVSVNTANNNYRYGLYLSYSDNNIVSGNKLLGNKKCIFEENCEGNIFKNNDCGKETIVGYNPFFLLVILSVVVIILRKKIKQS